MKVTPFFLGQCQQCQCQSQLLTTFIVGCQLVVQRLHDNHTPLMPVRGATSNGQMKMMHKVRSVFAEKTAGVQVLPSPSKAC